MTIDEMVKALENGGFDALLATLDPSSMALMNLTGELYMNFPYTAQFVALPVTFGTACAVVEGETTEHEKLNKELVTFEGRLKVFIAIARITYDAAMKAREAPDSPKRPKSQVM